MNRVVAVEQWQRMDEIVEWYQSARIVSGVASKAETSPLLIRAR